MPRNPQTGLDEPAKQPTNGNGAASPPTPPPHAFGSPAASQAQSDASLVGGDPDAKEPATAEVKETAELNLSQLPPGERPNVSTPVPSNTGTGRLAFFKAQAEAQEKAAAEIKSRKNANVAPGISHMDLLRNSQLIDAKIKHAEEHDGEILSDEEAEKKLPFHAKPPVNPESWKPNNRGKPE